MFAKQHKNHFMDKTNKAALAKLLLKSSLATGIGTGFVLGILNRYFKIGNFPKKES